MIKYVSSIDFIEFYFDNKNAGCIRTGHFKRTDYLTKGQIFVDVLFSLNYYKYSKFIKSKYNSVKEAKLDIEKVYKLMVFQ